MCVGHLIHPCHLQHFPPMLQQFTSHAIGLIGYEEFDQVRLDRFMRSLVSLCAEVGDVDHRIQWARPIPSLLGITGTAYSLTVMVVRK